MSTPSPHLTSLDDARTSVSHLLTRASSYPCSAATPAFSRLAQSSSTFQLALDALLPVLDPPTPSGVTDRILVAFILFSLYAPHPISINPFKSVLFVTFIKEREKALAVAGSGSVAPNETLVWVLWKILRGDGDEIGPYCPSELARSSLPPDCKVTELILDDKPYLDDAVTSYEAPAPEQRRVESDRIFTKEEDERNEAIAHAMRLLLSARTRVLSLAEQRNLTPLLPALAASQLVTPPDLAPLAAHNPALAHPLFAALLAGPAPASARYIAALASLPPTLPTFDVLGRLLRDPAVAALVRTAVIGRFISASIDWLDRAEREEREGLVSDDRFAQGLQHLCRFYASLIKHGLIDPASADDSAAMAHFSLRHARFEEANVLYRVLAGGRGDLA
ncbi:hypothetical protein B0H17DRAFT_1216761 [Mycena rosella]|uniref:CCR4-NOT transcription complex subunit 11 n=1 Tax=Mycena rosella TaxID=1033263 RepID=A0AAD7C6A3_MYCRO|nr:hypothetical protein B0H17DRAFT_1216761 [Mycena rosella]